MGFWSTSLYGNDFTLDVKEKIDFLLKQGYYTDVVYQEMLKCFSEQLLTDEEPLFWLALADRMWDYGLLSEEIKGKALKFISDYACLNFFETLSEKRSWQKTLNKLKMKIENINQGNKKIKLECLFKKNIWNIGDYYAYQLHKKYSEDLGIKSKYVIIKKIGENYYGDSMTYYNIVVVYNKIFDNIPSLEDLNNIDLLPLEEKEELYDDININEELRKIMDENFENSLQGDLYYVKFNDYESDYYHFIGNNSKNSPYVKKKNNSYLEFKTLEKDLCDFFKSWSTILFK